MFYVGQISQQLHIQMIRETHAILINCAFSLMVSHEHGTKDVMCAFSVNVFVAVVVTLVVLWLRCVWYIFDLDSFSALSLCTE